ncbi:host attachment protein [Legionella gresilensis]|uniref:host attachment protein n=1 Tax=Legionella gresilensis TaxID=91823 RepID=UPI0010414E05|nr:host attachment protein [Legionella gresilensis]
MKWIILANTNECRIYYYDKKSNIRVYKEISHPENKLKNQDLDTDKPGRYAISGSATRGTFTERNSSIDYNIDRFAHEIAQELEQADNHNQYEAVTLIMPAQLYGLVHHYLSNKIQNKIKQVIQKNIMNLPEQELADYLKKAG